MLVTWSHRGSSNAMASAPAILMQASAHVPCINGSESCHLPTGPAGWRELGKLRSLSCVLGHAPSIHVTRMRLQQSPGPDHDLILRRSSHT